MNCELPDVQAGFRKGRGNQRSNCQHPLDHWKSKRVPEEHLLLLYWLRQSLWLCASQQTVENSSRDGNTTPPYLPPEKSICRSKSNSWNQSVVPCPVLTVASWPHTDFSGGRSGGLVFPSLSEFSTVYCDPHSQRLWHSQSRSRVFLELSCFFNDPMDVGNLISGSSAFSKSSLNIWMFSVHEPLD